MSNTIEEVSHISCERRKTPTLPLSLDMSSKKRMVGAFNDDMVKRYQTLKRFDIVQGCSDHYFAKSSHPSSIGNTTNNKWSRKIQKEWKILANDLPDSIFVRVYEERMDLMHAAIVGASGTPYQNGLFFFDICFASNYPADPPYVYYHSHGIGLNPNMYSTGRVCLSLLNAWFGDASERWDPSKSTILQVLVSIQGLVLNEDPYVNEPLFAFINRFKLFAESNSRVYKRQAFTDSCRMMLYTMKGPPLHFEEIVVAHFCDRAVAILDACQRYVINDKVRMRQIFPALVDAFTNIGADCGSFLNKQKVQAPSPSVNEPGVHKPEAAKSAGKSWKPLLYWVKPFLFFKLQR